MQSPYPLNEKDEFTFEFTTQSGITYSAVFISYSGIFHQFPEIADFVYTFNIDIIDGNPESSTQDERVGITVAHIFQKFFETVENSVLYVCDNLDERQLARKRKFDYWFWRYNDGSILKEDGYAIVEGIEIINSILVSKKNPYLLDILFAFGELNESAGDK